MDFNKKNIVLQKKFFKKWQKNTDFFELGVLNIIVGQIILYERFL